MIKIYGFTIGEHVETTEELQDENGEVIKAGSELVLVAFAPKTIATKGKQYFFNAVRRFATRDNKQGARVRAEFASIRHIKNQ